MATVRLQKVLARAGIASRRAAEELIATGHVRVDGKVVTELGTKVDERTSRVEVDGQRIVAESLVYIALHKPRGVVSTMHDPEGRPSVRELLAEVPGRVYPIGRLDFATSGVLLATNDGDFAEALMHPRRAVPKTYVVKVHGEMKPEDLDRWRKGVDLEDGKTLPARAKLLRYEGDKTWFELTITEGRNQQIRRMGIATDFRVMRLSRLAFAGVTGEGLRPGEWRYLTHDELTDVKKEHGVPRRVVHPPMQPKKAARKPRLRPAGDETVERAGEDRAKGDRGGGDRAKGARAGGDRAKGARAGGDRARGDRSRGHRPGPTAVRPPRPRPAGDPAGDRPRYGGGAPARRDVNVREDWGGGVRRGSSGGRDTSASSGPPARGNHPSSPAPRSEAGGRGGRTRTTGTGGGIGGGEGSYRVRGRRG
jgi:23S rRNA pseudouridine2605 synthase